jgi:hypothetical protein
MQGLQLATPAILAISLQPSACVPRYIAHPGVDALLKTKAQPQFDSTVDRTVEVPFLCFSTVQSGQFSAFFLILTCPVGRGSQPGNVARREFAAQQNVIVSERRSRESNDLNQTKPHPVRLIADH